MTKEGKGESKSINANFRRRIPAEACYRGDGVFGELLIVPFMNKQFTREATVVRLVNKRVEAESYPG